MGAGAASGVRGPVHRLIHGFVRTLILAFFDFRTEGEEKVPVRGGAILASTHESHLDPVMVTAPITTRRIGYVARSTLFGSTLFGWLIARMGARSFDREEGGSRELRGIVAALRDGDALVFFPEGTRSPDGRLGALKAGVAMLACRSGVPVVPIAVDGTHECWPRGRKWFRRGRVRVVYGDPVTYGAEIDRAEVLADLGGRLRALKERAERMA